MKIRYGKAESLIDSCYIIQEKRWWGWKTLFSYKYNIEGLNSMMHKINDFQKQGIICINMD
jgi:hypothetical protein